MMDDKAKSFSINTNGVIYVPYSVIESEESYFQFFYRSDGKYTVDDDSVITNSPNYYVTNIKYKNGLPVYSNG
jgi:hypothetical protein